MSGLELPQASVEQITEALRAIDAAIGQFDSTGKWTVFKVGDRAKLKLDMEESKVMGAKTFMEQGNDSEVDASIRKSEITLSQNTEIVAILRQLSKEVVDMQEHPNDFSRLKGICENLLRVAPAAVTFLNSVILLKQALF